MDYYYHDENGNLVKKKKNKISYDPKTKTFEGDDGVKVSSDEIVKRVVKKKNGGDLAPVKDDEEKQQKWYEGWLDKGAFEDGYQFGDLTKTMWSSGADLKSSFLGGILEMGEGVVDAGAYLVGGAAKLFGADEAAENIKGFIAKDLYDGKEVAGYLSPEQYILNRFGADSDKNSVWGDKTDSLAQSAGQLAGTVGLQAVGVPWWVTSGVTSFGGSTEQAFNEGADYGEAGLSASISAGAEILTEKLFGGSGLGEKGLFNIDKLTKGISNKVVKGLADYGIDILGEGSEEVISSVMSNLGTALYKEENLKDILASEEAVDEYIQSFISGAALGGIANAGNVKGSVKQKTDYRSGLTESEQKVFDKVYNDAVSKAEKGGHKLSGREKAKIHDDVMEQLEKGYISTDTIESVLDDKTFGEYTSAAEQEKALNDEITELENLPESKITVKQRERLTAVREELASLTDKSGIKTRLTEGVRKQIAVENERLTERNSYLDESYRETERKGNAFEADLTKYKGKQREAVERAVKSGVLNNTNRSHELVDILSKIEADKGIAFDYADNAKLKESGFAIDGKTVNGFVKDGSVTLNIQSPKAWQSVVGHEITHILEGTEAYGELQKALFDYAGSKGELESRKADLAELYKDMNADVDAELTADLVGDYLFGDNDFVKHLTESRNVFQKVYDEIKYLWNTATGKEKAEIEKVKRQFDNAWKELSAQKNTAENGGVKYDISGKYDYSKSFAEQVDDWKKGLIPERDSLIVSGTPKIYQNIGFTALPMTINQTHVDYALNGTKDADHKLGETLLKQLPDRLKNPIAVFKSETKPNRVVALLDFTHNGKQIVAPVEIDGFSRQNNKMIDSNAITSVLGKTNAVTKLLYNAVFEEINGKTALYYWNKKVAVSLLQKAGHQLSGVLPQDGYIHSISDSGSNVNKRFENQTQTQQFKRWFGDWEKHPEKIEPVLLNENGEPKVYYHATNESFNVFSTEELNSREGSFFFAENREDAEAYGKNVFEVYLTGKKFANYDNQPPEFYRLKDKRAQVEWLKQRGYDGWYSNMDSGGWGEVSVFYPEQIKSATENIGTFDKDNPDIRFLVSNQDEQNASGTPLNEMYYEDIAPVRENVSETAENNAFAEEAAPAAEDIASIAENAVKAEIKNIPEEDIAPMPEESPGTEGRAAQVLAEEPKRAKEKSGMWAKFKTNFIDKGSAVEDLSLKTKNRALQDKYKAIGRSEAKAQYFMEHGAEGVKSLDGILKEVEETGNVTEFETYLYHRHNIDRMSFESREAPRLARLTEEMKKLGLFDLGTNQLKAIANERITKQTTPERAKLINTVKDYLDSAAVKNKPVFGSSVTAEMSQKAVKDYEAAHPEYKAYAEDVYGYMNHLRQMMVDGGVISAETAKLWSEMYPHYVPIRRYGKDGAAIDVPLDTRRTGVNAPVHGAAGGDSDINPLRYTIALRTLQTFKAVDKNRFGIELKNTLNSAAESEQANLDEIIDGVDTQDSLLQEGKNGRKPTFTVFENGERVTFEITDELYDAMKPTGKGLSLTLKPLNAASNLHKKVLTEYNGFFTARNAVKDAQDVLINSQHPVKTYANFPKALSELIKGKGEFVNEYYANGGKQNTYFDKSTNTFADESADDLAQKLAKQKAKSRFKKLVGLPLEGISRVNEVVEAVPRLAEYIASRKNGATVDAAMLDAARVTTDFSAGGDVTKFLNRNGATFLNASVQGAAQQIRNIREAKANGFKGVMKLAAKYAAAGLPALLFNALLWDDDEEYAELSDYVKDNYYVVGKYGDGEFVRIPKGRTPAVIQELFEQIGRTAAGEESDWGNVFKLAVANLAPNNPLEDNVIAPIRQAATNKTWYGDDLVPARLQDVPAAEQYDETIDSISKWLGENTGISPYKINYVLDQYSGFLGDIILPALTPQAEKGESSPAGYALAPLKDAFTVDSTMKNQNIAAFYDKADELKVNANSKNATDEDILKNKYMSSVSSDLGELYKAKREAQNSGLSNAEKYRRVREIQQQINYIAENSLDSYNDVSVSGSYATVGDRHYRKNDDGEWEKLSAAQFEKQENITRELGISAADYWGSREKLFSGTSGGYGAYKAYSEDLQGIKADKDAQGKTVSGSRKDKVLDYINNLDADFETKIMLFKSEYPSDDTYNWEIIDYINGRSDLTYEERTAAFAELGFIVKDGYIYWD